jgi:hypothetical protein
LGLRRRGIAFALLFCLAPVPARPQAPADPEIARGIKLVEDGDYDAAIVLLDSATRRLSAGGAPSRALGEAFLYLGVAYLAKGHEVTAKARFREALAQAGDLRLSAEKFAPKVMELFEAARVEADRAKASPSPGPSPAAQRAAPEKKGGSKKGLLFGGLGVVAAGGAVAALAGGGGDSSSPSSSSAGSTYRLDPADTQSLAPHGGGGASNRAALTCPSGSVMTGVTGAASSVLTRIGIVCRVLNADGSTGTDVTLPAVGGQTDGAPFVDSCGAGQAVVHLFGTVDNPAAVPSGLLSSVGVACARIADWVAGTGVPTRLASHGGPIGASFTDPCPNGYVVTAVNAETGALVDRIQGACTRVRR